MKRSAPSPRPVWLLALVPAAGLALAAAAEQRPVPGLHCLISNSPVAIPAGTVLLGEDGAGRPGRAISVPNFRIDRHEVTNRQFAAFVAATGYRTQAEREGASAVFIQPTEPVSLDNAGRWWRMVRGADWRHPQGPQSSIVGREYAPVVHVDRADAAAYARWVGGSLPSEAQWERAARGNQTAAVDPSAWAFDSKGTARANVWEGVFPIRNTGEDGFVGIAAVGCFAPNEFGIHDMVGNVWEWTASDDAMGLVKGGSYLCAMNYCTNFRPAAFQAQEADLGTSHIGFRVVYERAR